jgi:putative oxidoreductase
MTALGLLIVRLTVGATFVAHGLHKLFGIGGGPGVGPGGLDQTAAQFTTLGLSPAFVLAVFAGVTQLAGGILLVTGLLTRWAALALIAYCAIVIWADHGRWGFFLNWINAPGSGHGIEYLFVLMGALGCLLVTGGGEWSLDGRRARSVARTAAGRARARRG